MPYPFPLNEVGKVFLPPSPNHRMKFCCKLVHACWRRCRNRRDSGELNRKHRGLMAAVEVRERYPRSGVPAWLAVPGMTTTRFAICRCNIGWHDRRAEHSAVKIDGGRLHRSLEAALWAMETLRRKARKWHGPGARPDFRILATDDSGASFRRIAELESLVIGVSTSAALISGTNV